MMGFLQEMKEASAYRKVMKEAEKAAKPYMAQMRRGEITEAEFDEIMEKLLEETEAKYAAQLEND